MSMDCTDFCLFCILVSAKMSIIPQVISHNVPDDERQGEIHLKYHAIQTRIEVA